MTAVCIFVVVCSEGVVFEQNGIKDRVLEFRFKMHLMLSLHWTGLLGIF